MLPNSIPNSQCACTHCGMHSILPSSYRTYGWLRLQKHTEYTFHFCLFNRPPHTGAETKKSQLQFIIFALEMNNGRPILRHFKYLTALFRRHTDRPTGHLHLSSSSSVCFEWFNRLRKGLWEESTSYTLSRTWHFKKTNIKMCHKFLRANVHWPII